MSVLSLRPWLLLLTLCGFLFFYGLDAGELWRTECLRAMIAAESLRDGHWLVPTLYGQPFLTKPPGMYAAIALASWQFGEVREWTARLPSALAATATVFLFYWHFRRQLGRSAGLVAALILPTSFMWLDKAPSAEIDMLQTAWIAGAIVFFLRALESEEGAMGNGEWGMGNHIYSPFPIPHSPLFWWFAAFLCVAGGFLTKWTAPVFFYGTVIPLLWWRGRLRLLLGRGHVAGAALAAAICLGWVAVAVHTVGWDEFAGTVGREALQRLSYGHHEDTIVQLGANHHRKLPAWAAVLLHPLRIGLINLPWSAIALFSLVPGFMGSWDERGRRLLQAMHCWTWPNLIFWSVLPDHASRHSFPLFPGIAGLAAMVWIGWMEGKIVLGISRSQALPGNALPRGSASPPDNDVSTHRGILSSTQSVGAGIPTQSVGTRSNRPSLALGAGKVLLAFIIVWCGAKLAFVHAIVPSRNAHRQLPRAVGEQIARAVPAGQTLFLCRLKDEGIMFYYGRPVRRLAGFDRLPSSAEPAYCILEETEWRNWPGSRPAKVLLQLRDEQRKPIVLIRAERALRSRDR